MHAREEMNLSRGEKSCVGALQLFWLCSETPPDICSELSHREACEQGRSWPGRFVRAKSPG